MGLHPPHVLFPPLGQRILGSSLSTWHWDDQAREQHCSAHSAHLHVGISARPPDVACLHFDLVVAQLLALLQACTCGTPMQVGNQEQSRAHVPQNLSSLQEMRPCVRALAIKIVQARLLQRHHPLWCSGACKSKVKGLHSLKRAVTQSRSGAVSFCHKGFHQVCQ